MEHYQSLGQFFGMRKVNFTHIDPSDYVHMIIDVQGSYCKRGWRGSRHTEYIGAKIAKQKPLLEEFGMRSMIVYQDVLEVGYKEAAGGLYKISFNQDRDYLCAKTGYSPFSCGNGQQILNDHGIKNLIVSGFNAQACVIETVKEALCRDFNVLLLNDCIGQDRMGCTRDPKDSVKQSIQEMCDLGAKAVRSEHLRYFLSVMPLSS